VKAKAEWLESFIAARRKLTELEVRTRRATRQLVAKGATKQLQAVKSALTRQRSGLLKKSLGKRVQTYRDGLTVGIVGVRRGFAMAIAATVAKGRAIVGVGKRLVNRGRLGYVADPKGREIKVKVVAGVRKGEVMDPAKYGPLIERGHKKRGGGETRKFPFVSIGAKASAGDVLAMIRAGFATVFRGGEAQ
jgi:hypothetical protein